LAAGRLLLLCTHAALAQSARRDTAVSGQGAARAREAVVGVLSDQRGVELVAEADAEATAAAWAPISTPPTGASPSRAAEPVGIHYGEVRKHGHDLDSS